MSYCDKKVLVTGADGFIGSHLAEALTRAGARVTALALYSGADRHGWLDEIDPALRVRMRLVRGDVRDSTMMRRLSEGQDIIFHLAALIAIPHSYDAPLSYIDVNISGTGNILEALRAGTAGKMIHTSTSEVYGSAQTIPIAESHPLVAQSPYAATKIAADKLTESYALSFGLNVAILRPFNTYGPRQSERAVISSTIRQALDPQCHEIAVGDTSTIRDFNYVADTVSSFLDIGSTDTLEWGSVYQSGSGRGVTIAEMIDVVRSVTGTNKPIAVDKNRLRPKASEVRALVADAARLHKATGWQPRTSLEEGIAATTQWWRDRWPTGAIRADASYLT